MQLQIKKFSTRLGVYILTVTVTLFVVSFIIYYQYSSKAIVREAFSKSTYQVENLALRIENTLDNIETVVDELRPYIERFHTNEAFISNSVNYILENSPNIDAVAIAFEPHYIDDSEELFMLYNQRDNMKNKPSKFVGKESYNYLDMEWYKIPKEKDDNLWSEPYIGAMDNDSTRYIVTYSSVMMDDEGNFVGVLAVDLRLDLLGKMVEEVQPYENSYSYMVSPSGYYLAHKHHGKILKETYISANTSMQDSTVNRIGRDMLEGKGGMGEYVLEGVRCYEFYQPIPSVGWSVAIVSQKSDIIAELISTTKVLIIIVAFSLLLIFFLTAFVLRRSTKNLMGLAASAKIIAKGNFDVEIPPFKHKDEVSNLRDSFMEMQSSLKDYIERLKISTQAAQRIESELHIATTIQMDMLPTLFPPFDGREEVELYATMTPAKEVGGDLYDFFFAGDSLYFTIGDVAGKGVPASLFMALTSSVFRASAKYLSEPSLILKEMNRFMFEKNSSDLFTTLFIGKLDLKSGEMKYANAGHNPPILMREGKATLLSATANLPLGVLEDMDFKAHSIVLSLRDTLLLYTDGLTEAENERSELYSAERLLALLTDNINEKSTKGLIEKIGKSVEDFTKGTDQSDDMTMLALRLTPVVSDIQRLTIENKVEDIALLSSFVEEWGERQEIAPSEIFSLNLALEELISNVILYAFPSGAHSEIEIAFERAQSWVVFTIEDRGVAFDPTKPREVDTTKALEEREIGGLGIFLAQKIIDEMSYRRKGEKNILTLRKKLK
ncbi:MAG: SpoIIE family protein phosphatase [Rikenellaceae bacterium]